MIAATYDMIVFMIAATYNILVCMIAATFFILVCMATYTLQTLYIVQMGVICTKQGYNKIGISISIGKTHLRVGIERNFSILNFLETLPQSRYCVW